MATSSGLRSGPRLVPLPGSDGLQALALGRRGALRGWSRSVSACSLRSDAVRAGDVCSHCTADIAS